MRKMTRRRLRPSALLVAALLGTTLVSGVGGQTAQAAPPVPARQPDESVLRPAEAQHDPPSKLPPGFAQQTVVSGLTEPTAVAFAPDGKTFIAEKSGIIRVRDSVDATTGKVFADLRTEVFDGWDRGLIGLAVHPKFPQQPYVYALYTYDAPPGETAPKWNDKCPSPPGYTEDGCVVTNRIVKLTMGADGISGAPETLVSGWCQQYPSHTADTIAFGPDGLLYASAGEGASFNFVDYGQQKNPCADPPGGAGTNLTIPDARGGSLRSQSPRRPGGEPMVLNGTVIRVDPLTGQGVPGNPYASSTDENARRIVAYGMRNPFRFTLRPQTGEVWLGDVGETLADEINRFTPDPAKAPNMGWPCFEGKDPHPGWKAAGLKLCESLYAEGGDQKPVLQYAGGAKVSPDDTCPNTSGASLSGFAFADGQTLPEPYRNSLFFSDSTRGCIWVMGKDAQGAPDPAKVTTFASGLGVPVQLAFGPGGSLYYVSVDTGELRRISYDNDPNVAPQAVIKAKPAAGRSPLFVRFDGRGSTDPEGARLRYEWDLDGDGQFDDRTGPTASWLYLKKQFVRPALKVTDPGGKSSTAKVDVVVDNAPPPEPVPVITTPAPTLTWQVGQRISFSGGASDAQDGPLPASALDWKLTMRHCAGDGHCHSHDIETFAGTASGEFAAPDHPYPSHLELTLTATDSDGNVSTKTIELQPQTVDVTFKSDPPGIGVTVGNYGVVTDSTVKVIVGTALSVSAAGKIEIPPYELVFDKWGDGAGASRIIKAPEQPATYTVYYRVCPC
ncbi:PQQ-dependent sugar dehydrogenase [Amycolatopsis speibonae]|uniref:PQQ-dependent sugar dehydrogenase n=2 Tax=Amycolatopsis speibonae TaxID=1450224 RepID=A0ABV7P8M0_9PSEU